MSSGAAARMRGSALAAALIAAVSATLSIGASPDGGTRLVSNERALDRWALALGGRKTLRRVVAVHFEGSFEMGGLKGTYERWSTASGKLRVAVDIPGAFRQVIVFDGHEGWLLDKSGTVSDLSGGALANVISSAYEASYSFLIPGRMDGRVNLAGSEGGSPARVMRLDPKGGVPVTVTLDGATSLPQREESQGPMGTRTITFSNWENHSGLEFPGTVRQSNGDPKLDAIFRIAKVEINGTFPAGLFEKPVEDAAPARFAAGARQAVIPVEVYAQHVFVPVRLGASETGWFFLDSGAAQSFVSTERAEKADLTVRGALGAQGTGAGSTTMGMAAPVALNLPGVEIPMSSIAVWDFSSLRSALGRSWDGDLGHDVISRFVVRVDYERKELTLIDPGAFVPDPRATVLPLSFMGTMPLVRGTIALPGRPAMDVTCAIDSGASGLHLSSHFVKANHVRESLRRTISASSLGAGGESIEMAGRIDGLQLGPHLLRGPVVAFTPELKDGLLASSEIDALVGGEILERFTVTFDYPHRRILLEPNGRFADPFLADESGLSMVATGTGFHHVEIDGVEPGSPAAAAGVLRGDVIAAVDGHDARELDLEAIGRLFQRAGRSVRLSVERDGTRLTISLELTERL